MDERSWERDGHQRRLVSLGMEPLTQRGLHPLPDDHGSEAILCAMSISPAEVQKIARLARLAITDEQAAAYGPQLSAILSHMDTLRGLDLKGVEPLTHVGETVNRLDADQPGKTLPADVLMKLAPEAMPPFVKVPKVIGDGGGS